MKNVQRMSSVTTTAALATVMAVAFATTARAGPPDAATSTRSVVVRYAHRDLHSEAGVRSLYRELQRAARRACAAGTDRQLTARADTRRCRNAALADAVDRLADGRLQALHGGESNGPLAAVPAAALRR